MNYKILGKRIREERRIQGLTQEQLSEKVNISSVFLSQIETANKIPSLDTIYKISKELSVTIDSLLTDENKYVRHSVDLLLKSRTEKESLFIFKAVKQLLSNIKDDNLNP